jgi:hypothetical protein
MIRAVLTGTKKGKPNKTIFLGIDKGNVNRLVEGQPILVEGDTLGMPGLDVAIHYGTTLPDVLADLRAAGLPIPEEGRD